jgi:hypothetical protein
MGQTRFMNGWKSRQVAQHSRRARRCSNHATRHVHRRLPFSHRAMSIAGSRSAAAPARCREAPLGESRRQPSHPMPSQVQHAGPAASCVTLRISSFLCPLLFHISTNPSETCVLMLSNFPGTCCRTLCGA